MALSQESDEPHSWNHHISTGNHGGFDVSEEIISFEIFNEEVSNAVRPLTDLEGEGNIKVVEEFKKKVHKEYLDELRSKRKSTKKLRRGGFSYVLCTVHEYTPYCVCQTKDEG